MTASAVQSSQWLLDLMHEAQEEHWCTMPYCRICGGSHLRSEVFRRACEAAGIEEKALDWKDFHRAMFQASKLGREAMVSEIIKEVKSLTELDFFRRDYLMDILVDMNGLCGTSNGVGNLDSMLGGSAAGVLLSEMRAHHAAKIRNHSREMQTQAEHRKRKELEQANYVEPVAVEQRPQRVRISTGAEPVHQFLREYISLTPTEQLKTIAGSQFSFPLAVIPREFIPTDGDLTVLSTNERDLLSARIDNRTGRWGRLKEALMATA